MATMLDEFGVKRSAGNQPRQIAPGLAYLRDRIVNIAFIGSSDGHEGSWVLVDTGMAGAASRIINAAELLFGEDTAPAATGEQERK